MSFNYVQHPPNDMGVAVTVTTYTCDACGHKSTAETKANARVLQSMGNAQVMRARDAMLAGQTLERAHRKDCKR